MEADHQIQYMDNHFSDQYNEQMAWIYGENWLCIGGEYTTRDFVSGLGLSSGQRVLDVCCGAGGAALHMAKYYGVRVHGIDVATSMINSAQQQQQRQKENVKQKLKFEKCDIQRVTLEDGYYDLVFCRESLLFIKDKDILLNKLYRSLKPKGTLFFTDFLRGTNPRTDPAFTEYFINRKRYIVETSESYRQMLQKAGFVNIQAQDLHQDFIDIHKRDLRLFTTMRHTFVETYGRESFDRIVNDYVKKIHLSQEGHLSWGAFTASTPDRK